MKKLVLFLFMLPILSIIISCEQEEDTSIIEKIDTVSQPGYGFMLFKNTYTAHFSKEGGTDIITLLNHDHWWEYRSAIENYHCEATVYWQDSDVVSSWYAVRHIYSRQKKGTCDIKVIAEPNNTGKSRYDTLFIVYYPVYDHGFIVIQQDK